jgi:hypothetical protein
VELYAQVNPLLGLPRYRAMFEAAGFGADLAACYAAPRYRCPKLAISEQFIEQLCNAPGGTTVLPRPA